MNLKLITAATEEPVSLPEFQAHARLDSGGSDESDQASKLLAARMHVESLTRRALVSSTWQLFLNGWPVHGKWNNGSRYPNHCHASIPIPLGNLTSVTAITYTDSTGTVNTIDPASYEIDLLSGEILLADGYSWPSAQLKHANPICIEFVAGWTNSAAVPQPIKAAILLLAAHWYRNREAVVIGERSTVESTPLGMAVDALLANYTLWRF